MSFSGDKDRYSHMQEGRKRRNFERDEDYKPLPKASKLQRKIYANSHPPPSAQKKMLQDGLKYAREEIIDLINQGSAKDINKSVYRPKNAESPAVLGEKQATFSPYDQSLLLNKLIKNFKLFKNSSVLFIVIIWVIYNFFSIFF